MGTQAVVSVRKDGQMVFKFVVGCNGAQAPDFADGLRSLGHVPTLLEALEIAATTLYGCSECFITVTPEAVRPYSRYSDYVDEPNSLYRRTFDDPRFNPRWEQGTAAYTEIVDF